MDRTSEIKAGLEEAKEFIGSIIDATGHGEKAYSGVLKALAYMDEQQSPTPPVDGKLDLEKLKSEFSLSLLVCSYINSSSHESIIRLANSCFERLVREGLLNGSVASGDTASKP